MNRRRFLASSALALAAAGVAPGQARSLKRAFPKAVNLRMVKAGQTALEKFQLVKEAGFEGVELNRPDVIPLDEILAASRETGVPVVNVTCSTHWGKPLTHHDLAVREQGLRGLKLALQEAGELKAPTLLLVPGVVSAEVSYLEAYTRSQAAIREAIPVAEKAGVKIAIENVWSNFLLSPLESARFVDELASPWVGWHFDIGNVVTTGWPEQWIRILGKRILTVHIKEFSRKVQEAEGLRKGFRVELGEGDVNWAAVMTALDEIGFGGWAILEVPGGDLERLKFLSERTNRLFNGNNQPG